MNDVTKKLDKRPQAGTKLLKLSLPFLLFGITSISSAQPPGRPDQAVSNVEAMREQVVGMGAGESGSRGTRIGGPDDSHAEFRRSPESAEEVWSLWSRPPARAPIGIETIIGADERFRVTPTTNFPESAVVLITFDGGRCSGWLYGRDIVGTAGHCVHEGGSAGNWRQNVRVYPGRDGSSSPFGSCSAKRLHSVLGWTRDQNEEFDYGAIKLNCSIGDATGWFGYWWQTGSLLSTSTTISGYPGDKPLEHWRSLDQVRDNSTNQVFYFNDTLGGMSGSATYVERPPGSPWCVGYCVMSVHAYGLHGSPPHSDHNHGTRITEARFNNLKMWKDAP